MTAKPLEALQDSVLEIGTRLKTAPSDLLVNAVFAPELSHQEPLFEAMGLADIAYTLCAMDWRIIPETGARALLAQLLRLQQKPDSFVATPALGDLYTNREAWLAERTEAVGWLGAGRARREATTTAFVIVMRHLILELKESLTALGQVLIRQAERHKLSVMPDYTYLQAAQPTTFGHYLSAFAYPLLRDLERLESLLTRLNKSPVGCGSSNGSRLARGRLQAADLLGFAGIIPHARDAMWQADLCIESMAILTSCSINLSRLAEDLQVYNTQEFALIALDDRHARASKIMPQKKNPFALTHIRGVANKMIGVLASVAAAARTPSGQPDNRLAIYAELPAAMQDVKNAAALMAEVLPALNFNSARGKALVDSGWVLATDLCETLVQQCGLDFRSAHRLTAFLARQYQGKSILELDHESLSRFSEQLLGRRIMLTEQQLGAALDARLAIQARVEPGGTASSCMNDMLAECRAQLDGYERGTQTCKAYFAAKHRELLARAALEAANA